MTVDPILVKHAAGTYPVLIQPGAVSDLSSVVEEYLPGRRVALVVDQTVLQLYRAGRLGQPDWTGAVLSFPAGEPSKTRETWTRLTDELIDLGFGRDSGIAALGGGVTGDLAGFVAATFMRGLPYVQVPTTLLAMVDASVGGKTGVDTPQGKNLVGSFHPPVSVVADPLTLTSLPEAEYRSGLAEAVKHGIIADRDYFEWMERNVPGLIQRNVDLLGHLVRRSVEIKAEVVSSDERETGRRAILNAGHTVAHSLERVSQYRMLHGEAVAVGLTIECAIAEAISLAEAGLSRRVAKLLTSFGLPTERPKDFDPSAILANMQHDKKNRGSEIRFALPAALGRMPSDDGWTRAVPLAVIRRALESR